MGCDPSAEPLRDVPGVLGGRWLFSWFRVLLMGDVLELKEATVRRGGRNILDHLDWDVFEGERWVVLGPNGAGKTTTLRMVLGLIGWPRTSVQQSTSTRKRERSRVASAA